MKPETEYAWLAGFIDGDGCFRFHKRKRVDGSPAIGQVVLSIGQRDRRPLDRVAKLLGGRVVGPWQKKNGEVYFYRLSSNKLNEVIDKIWPYLSEPKRESYLKAVSLRIESMETKGGRKPIPSKVPLDI